MHNMWHFTNFWHHSLTTVPTELHELALNSQTNIHEVNLLSSYVLAQECKEEYFLVFTVHESSFVHFSNPWNV